MIFLDMDGVLCDFASAAFAAHNQKYIPEQYPTGEWQIHNVLGVSQESFFNTIQRHGEAFWENLDPYPWTNQLVRALQQIDHVVIATSPTRCPYSYAGKYRWLLKHGFGNLDTMFGAHKWLMAKPKRWLIDDNPDNISAWNEQCGNTYCVPQPWNVGRTPPDTLVNDICNRIQRKA